MTEPLPNSRHEAFARGLARGLSATSAYVEAGYSARTAGRNAYRLMKDYGVLQRAEYLKQQAMTEAVMSATEVLVELSEIARTSTSVRDRLSALIALCRYHGLFVDRIDHTTGGEKVNAPVYIYLPDNDRDPSLTN